LFDSIAKSNAFFVAGTKWFLDDCVSVKGNAPSIENWLQILIRSASKTDRGKTRPKWNKYKQKTNWASLAGGCGSCTN